MLLILYLPNSQTMNTEYYSSLLVQLKVTKGVLFLHDNAAVPRALATQEKLAYLGFQCLDYSPYATDLALSDYH